MLRRLRPRFRSRSALAACPPSAPPSKRKKSTCRYPQVPTGAGDAPTDLPLPANGSLPQDLAETLRDRANEVVGQGPLNTLKDALGPKSLCPDCGGFRSLPHSDGCPRCQVFQFVGDWSVGDKGRVLRAVDVIRYRLPVLIADAEWIEKRLFSDDYDQVKTNLMQYISVLKGVDRLVNSDVILRIRQHDFESRDPDGAEGKYEPGNITLNTKPGLDWHDKKLDGLAILILHELSHHWGTHDGDGKNPLLHAQNLAERLFTDEKLIGTGLFLSLFGPYENIPAYIKPKTE